MPESSVFIVCLYLHHCASHLDEHKSFLERQDLPNRKSDILNLVATLTEDFKEPVLELALDTL